MSIKKVKNPKVTSAMIYYEHINIKLKGHSDKVFVQPSEIVGLINGTHQIVALEKKVKRTWAIIEEK